MQIKNAEGTWVEATPIPETILVNTGDLLYFWSGGRYPATVKLCTIWSRIADGQNKS